VRRKAKLKVIPSGEEPAARLIVLPKAKPRSGPAPSSGPGAEGTPKRRAPKRRQVFAGNRYKIESEVGSGGTGTVYKAWDRVLEMPVALKVLNPELARDRDAIAGTKKEARIAIQLSHRHIVRLYDFQKIGTNYFLIMEYVDGRSVRRILERHGRLPLDTVAQVVSVCSDALSYAHRHGVLHNDLKPDNLLLSVDGVLKIIDFGVATLVGRRQSSDLLVGTPIYMSPEQKKGEVLDQRTDVYALALVAYELLAGAPPFPPDASAADIVDMNPGELSAVAGEVRAVLEKAVATAREERWDSVADFNRAFLDAAEE